MRSLLLIIIILYLPIALFCQKNTHNLSTSLANYKIDSLGKRIHYLKNKLIETKSDPLNHFRVQSELDITEFKLKYENYVHKERLEEAKDFVMESINRAKNNYQDNLVEIYDMYYKDILEKIKNQRLKYQALFEKEKKFRKYIEPYMDEGSETSLKQADYILELAMNYAKEQNFTTATEFIKKYKDQVEATLYDMETNYNLDELTNKQKEFENVFTELTSSDDLDKFKEAQNLINHCLFYTERVETKCGHEYFKTQNKILESRLIKKEQELEISGMIKGGLVAKKQQPMDALNEFGIFKFYNKIIVIGRFNPSKKGMSEVNSNDLRVMKGMAIMNADKTLFTFIRRNVEEISDKTKVIYAYLVPYLV
ncbi:MAG: hypothetical protein ACOCUL_02785, partial [Bacteroidota bacterium]